MSRSRRGETRKQVEGTRWVRRREREEGAGARRLGRAASRALLFRGGALPNPARAREEFVADRARIGTRQASLPSLPSRRRGCRAAHLERHARSAHPRRFELLGDVLAVCLGVQIRAPFQRERDVEPARATFRRRPLRLRQVPERFHRPNFGRAQVQRITRMPLEVADGGTIGHGGHPKRGSDWCGLGARAS